jgi:hypothetical protein
LAAFTDATFEIHRFASQEDLYRGDTATATLLAVGHDIPRIFALLKMGWRIFYQRLS